MTSKVSLDRRWQSLSRALPVALGLNPHGLQVEAEYDAERVWAGIVGAACERVTRNRGGDYFVAPLLDLPRDLRAWLGFQEIWDKAPNGPHFNFHYLSVTVHFGFVGDPIKPQVFRAEWSGIRNWTGAGNDFQIPGAGHPHWQFDIGESLRLAGSKDPLEFEFEPIDKVEDFGEAIGQPNILGLVSAVTLERMHFASAAAWWKTPTPGTPPQHMNAPSDQKSLTLWLLSCIEYLRQELSRCEIATP